MYHKKRSSNPHADIWTSGTIKNGEHETPAAKSNDIREHGEKGEQFTSSGRAVQNKLEKSADHKSVAKDPDFNSDSTMAGENKVSGMYADPWAGSAKSNISRELKAANHKEVSKEKEFNS